VKAGRSEGLKDTSKAKGNAAMGSESHLKLERRGNYGHHPSGDFMSIGETEVAWRSR